MSTPATSNSALLRLAGFAFELRTDSEETQLLFPEAYNAFLVHRATGNPDAVFEVSSPPPDLPGKLETVWATDVWRLSRTETGGALLELNERTGDPWRPLAHVGHDFSAGSLFTRTTDPQPRFVFNYPCDQVLLINRMALLGAGVVHGCGIAFEGRAYLFCGRSGAGKTTIARLWRDAGATILNDDRMIVRNEEGSAWSGSTPWHGEEKDVHAACLPLGGVFHLRQASTNALRRLPYTEAVARLMATTVAPYYSREGISRILDVWAPALEHVPSWILDFTPDAGAVQACRSALVSDAAACS